MEAWPELSLRHLPLKCSQCQLKRFEAFVVHSAERVTKFLEGLTLDSSESGHAATSARAFAEAQLESD